MTVRQFLCIDTTSSEIRRYERIGGHPMKCTHEVVWNQPESVEATRAGLEQLRKFPTDVLATSVEPEVNPEDILCGG